MKIDAKFITKLSPKPGDLLVFQCTSPIRMGLTKKGLDKALKKLRLPQGVNVLLLGDLKLLTAEEIAQLSVRIENAKITADMRREIAAGLRTGTGRRKRNPGDGQ